MNTALLSGAECSRYGEPDPRTFWLTVLAVLLMPFVMRGERHG